MLLQASAKIILVKDGEEPLSYITMCERFRQSVALKSNNEQFELVILESDIPAFNTEKMMLRKDAQILDH